jgi:HD-GYP domain-containing protein (c-di-GMP phosphodiesterase class II)
MTGEQAVAELRRCAGTQFDPRVVEVLCEELASSADRGETTPASVTEPPVTTSVQNR